MKLHLPVRLFKSVLACLAAVASFSLGSGVAWAEAQNLTFSGSSLTWDTSAENKSFVDEEDAAASFAAGDNVSFTGESAVTLGENITAGTLDIAAGADVTIDLEEYTLHTDTISLSGTLDVGDSLSIASGSTLAVKNAAAVLDSALVLGEKSGLVVESAASLNSHTLTLQGGSNLILTAAGDGKTYTLFTGVSGLVDAEGNAITLDSTNNAIANYFDTTQPGTGFWKDATLVLNDGALQLVRHNETVKEAVTITTSQNRGANYQYYESVAFEYIYDGAIEGGSNSTIKLSNNGSVTFSGNTASSSSSDAYGGAIYGYSSSTISLSDNGSVTFSGNSASSYGGAIYGYSSSTISLRDNGSVTFSGNSAFRGGAIYTYGSVTMSGNGSVTFSGNSSSSYGGAIYGNDSSAILLSNNGSVTFSENTASGSSSGHGGAINTDGSVIMSGNDSVTFSGNKASSFDAYGGAIYGGGDITLSSNSSVEFSGNTASSSFYFAFGGAIYGSDIELSNNGSVTFSGNTASSSSSPARGGAIYGSVTMTDNGSVTFSGNSASSYGGAIYGYSSSTISLRDNGSVTFSGNSASRGGAIYTEGSLHICNNDSAEFVGNVEKGYSAYSLRSVYVYGGSGEVLSISAAAGKSVAFYDSIYVGSGTTVNLNADYEDAEGNIIEQKGDIVFTGATTEDDLYKAKGNVAGTEEEIRLSRTTEVNAMTNLYGGRLRVEDGAIYQGYGIIAHEGSEATVRVKDATLSHSGYDLIFNAGTTLELEGANTIIGNLDLMSGSSLVFENSGESGVTIHEGVLSIADDVCVDVRFDSSLWAEEYGETWDMVLLTTNATVEDGSVRYKISPLDETWGYTDVAWTDGTLAISFKKGAESALWQNTSGDYRWNTRSVNWMDGKYHFANVEGASVVLGQTGAGTITLEGAISIAGLSVEAGSSYELVLTEGASLSVSGALNVAENSQLDMGFGLSLSSVNNRGDLSLADDLTVSGAITGGGSLSVQGAASAASLQVGSLSVDSLTLTDATAQNTIGSSVLMDGAATVAGGLSIDGSLSAASLQAGSLSVDSLTLTDAEAQNNIGSSVSMAGAAMVAGGLNIEGSFAAASLQTGSLSADSLTLTDAEAQNNIGSSVTMSGAAAVAGGLSIEGSLTAASLQAGSLSATSLNLTTAEAQNSIGSSLSMTGNISVAGSLEIAGNLSAPEVSVGGELKAESLQTNMLTTQSLNLTDAELQNSIGSSVSMIGAATVAGGLNIEGSFSAASLQAGSLSVESLALTDAEAQNNIGSSVSMAGAATVAGGLNIEGSLTAASLQAGSLSADSLTLTEAGAANTVAGAVNIDGDVDVVGSLTVAGALNSANVGVGGALTAASLTVTALNADSLALTAANTANTVMGDLSASSVSLATGATLEVGGVLTADEIAFSGTAKAITAGSLGADSMNFVLDRAALESLGIGYRQSAAIVSADTAMGNGFAVTLNGDSAPVVAAAYAYTIGVNGGAVQLAADYAYDGMQVWYRGGWVGDSSWTDYFIAGFDAVEGKETVDLGGAVVTGSNLFIAYEEGVTTSTVQNGSLNFEYIDMGGGQFELGEGAVATTDELYGKGETLVMHECSTLDVTKLTLGTLALEAGTITVKDATLNTISGTEGTLNIASGGKVTVKSDVTLTGLNNEGTLSLGQKKLTVNALVDVGGNVTAGEVSVQSRGSRMASFDKLVADKVTVTNSVTAGRYTDDLSVGDGSAIGELVAETLEVRGGTVTLGRTSGSTEMSLLNLDLQEDATLVLNQQTALAVTDTLTATENATVQLKQDASLSYGEVYLTNKKSDSVASVNAYGLAGEADLQVQNAHVVAHAADATIDYQLVNSSVENAAGGTLKVTHENNTLNGVYATGGNVEVYNAPAAMSLDELHIAAGLSVSLMTSEPETYEAQASVANVAVVGLAEFDKGATLNANLTLAAGSELHVEEAVQLGGSLELVSGADSITLGGSMLDAVMNLGECESYTLFTGVDALTLTFDGTSVTYQPGTLNEGHKVLASTYFSNFVGTAQENKLYITFTTAEVGGGDLAFYMAPEPTTTTLSLLALAALAARRRRK